MIPVRPSRALQVLLALVVVATFVTAECLRDVSLDHASIAAKCGWSGFVVLFLWWLWEDCGVLHGMRRLGRLLLLGAIAFAVLHLYYRRAGIVDAGVEVDATYTFVGLGWFLTGGTVTFAGPTPSFAQMPMQLFGHLPGYVIGFDRLGPVAIHLANMLQVAFLLALLVDTVVPAGLVAQAGCVALTAGVFSNRFTVLLCNLTGYAIPSVAIGIMFLGLVLAPRSFERTAPWIGGLLMLSLMHHYPGFFFALPLVAFWVVAGPWPWRRIVTFVAANLPLWVILAMAIASVVLHPELLLSRLRDVTAPSLVPEDFRTKVAAHWWVLTHTYLGQLMKTFFQTGRSWHLLNIAPLTGVVVAAVATSWIMTGIALGRRALAFAGMLAVLAACLVALTALQYLVTDFQYYRVMTLLLALTTTSIGFVLCVPPARPALAAALIAYGLAVAVYQYVDVAELVGKRYPASEYAPADQATMETLRDYWRHDGGAWLRGAELLVASGVRFPLEIPYTYAAAEHGIGLHFVAAGAFCENVPAAVEAAVGTRCGTIAVALRGGTCDAALRQLGWPAERTEDGVAIYAFAVECDSTNPREWSTPELHELPLLTR